MTEKRTSGVNIETTAHLTALDAAGEAAVEQEIERVQRGKQRQIDFLTTAYPTMDVEALEPEVLQRIIDSLPDAIRFCADKLNPSTRQYLDRHLDRLARWFAGDKVSQLASDDKISQGHVYNWSSRLTKQVRRTVNKKTLLAISKGEILSPATTNGGYLGGIAINGAKVDLKGKEIPFTIIDDDYVARPDGIYHLYTLEPLSPKAIPASSGAVLPVKVEAWDNLLGLSERDFSTDY